MKKFSESLSTSTFKLGIDVHGVIDDLPEFFSFLTNSIISSGGEVHIITGGSLKSDDLINLIKRSGVKWTHMFSVYDHLMSSEEETHGMHKFSDGTDQQKFKDEIWNKVKGEYCNKNNISLHIDDTLVYGDYFTTPFAKLFSKKN